MSLPPTPLPGPTTSEERAPVEPVAEPASPPPRDALWIRARAWSEAAGADGAGPATRRVAQVYALVVEGNARAARRLLATLKTIGPEPRADDGRAEADTAAATRDLSWRLSPWPEWALALGGASLAGLVVAALGSG